jgi:VWFA-related protein
MKRIPGVSLLIVVLSAAMALSQAQAQTSSVKLDVMVHDGSDNPVTGLKQQDFTVSDNGKTVTPSSFAEVSKDDTPPTVVLVFDLVNDSVLYATLLRDQLTKVLQRNGGQLAYPTVLTVATSTGISSSQSPTTDGNALAAMLAKVSLGPDVNQRAGGSAGALQRRNLSIKAMNDVLGSASKIPGRKLVFWMSPGWAAMGGTTASPDQEQELFSAVKQYSTGLRMANITLYKLSTAGSSASVSALQSYRQYIKGVNAPNKTDFADLSLEVLAAQSGGLVLNSNDFGLMYDQCLKDAGDHYEIEIPAGEPAKNMAFHDVQVRVNRPGAVARTRDGYYPQ